MKVALAFSGGGYRASAFCLGTLTYLEQVKINNSSLLDKVIVLSTISGGTITGSRYAIGIKKGETLEDIYLSLYKFFLEVDLITKSTELLSRKTSQYNKRVTSLINSFADIYDEHLFKGDTLGILLREDNPIHLKHISFNATEFVTGLPFRFQISEKILFPKPGEPEKGIIGNYENRISEELAKHIRIADILAASSCFPGGFEPINFPTDFVFENENIFKDYEHVIALMDGGIVDNQGIEPIILAENRMKRNAIDKTDNNLDLIIVSDVSSPYMESFTASKQNKGKWYSKLTVNKIEIISIIMLLISVLGILISIIYNNITIAILSTLILPISGIPLLAIFYIKKKVQNNGTVNPAKLRKIANIEIGKIEGMITNRIMSVLKLTGGVFMKHIRRLNYNKIYGYESWKNRRIMNAIYELRDGEKKLQNKFEQGKIDEFLLPSPEMQKTSRLASDMETTLWFENHHLEKNVLNSLIACGQYNICWNLLEYIEKIKKDKTNTGAQHEQLICCETQLREDWDRFKKDPLWLLNQYNQKLNIK